MDYQPPPFFKRGPAPLALLTLYIAVAIAMMIVDLRFRYLAIVRDAVTVVVQPLQTIAHLPARGWMQVSDYFSAVDELRSESAQMRETRLEMAADLQRAQQLELENARLRRLLDLQAREPAAAIAVQVLHATRDPFVRRVIIDRGIAGGVVPGQAVIDDEGLIGQVTRVLPLSSEVTLISDKAQAVPVQLVRTGLRTVAFGIGKGFLSLRYLPAGSDITVGDTLVTSGLDGVYLPGLPVARVVQVERDSAYTFAQVLALPLAGVEHFSDAILISPPSLPAERPAGFDSESRKPPSAPPRSSRRAPAGAPRRRPGCPVNPGQAA